MRRRFPLLAELRLVGNTKSAFDEGHFIEIDVSKPDKALVAIVEHGNVPKLDEYWERPGVYVLIEPTSKGRCKVYVGMSAARTGVKGRINYHRSSRDTTVARKLTWTRAVAMVSSSDTAWDLAELRWLEDEIYQQLSLCDWAIVDPDQSTSGGNLNLHRQATLHEFPRIIEQILMMIGFSSVSVPRKPIVNGPIITKPQDDSRELLLFKKEEKRDRGVMRLIEEGLLEVGAKLRLVWHGNHYEATVLENGQIRTDGQDFDTPSGAGRHIRHPKPTNGWKRWKVVGSGNPEKSLNDLWVEFAQRELAKQELTN